MQISDIHVTVTVTVSDILTSKQSMPLLCHTHHKTTSLASNNSSTEKKSKPKKSASCKLHLRITPNAFLSSSSPLSLNLFSHYSWW